MSQPKGKYSVEKLVHFSCGECMKWWCVADTPEREYWWCPWCGHRQTFEPASPLDTVTNKVNEL